MSRLKWFKDHIGKRMYKTLDCDCDTCRLIYDHGILVLDSFHAEVLDEMEIESDVKFFETKTERRKYERSRW